MQEGPLESLFETPPQEDVDGGEDVAVEAEATEAREIPRILNEDISNFRAQGFAVDDDNEPAPENVPSPNDDINEGMYRPWGSEPLDLRRASSGVRDIQPTLVRADPCLHTVLGYFLPTSAGGLSSKHCNHSHKHDAFRSTHMG
jgi:hypothetical protein